MLVENGEVLLEVPLSARSWDRSRLEREFEDFERDLERISRLFNTFSNANRMRMMRAFFEREKSIAFTELMRELDMNPKLIWDSTRKLTRVGLIEKDDQGRYRTTREGEAQFLMASIALRKLFELLDEI
jgi:predicted transcriptional regulator